MCKHVAAVLYGVGIRLDEDPALFFTLRDVDQAELLGAATAGAASRVPAAGGKRIAADKLADVFGIELVDDRSASALSKTPRGRTRSSAGRSASRRSPART
jgi:uncharacterized Zn finger protein